MIASATGLLLTVTGMVGLYYQIPDAGWVVFVGLIIALDNFL